MCDDNQALPALRMIEPVALARYQAQKRAAICGRPKELSLVRDGNPYTNRRGHSLWKLSRWLLQGVGRNP